MTAKPEASAVTVNDVDEKQQNSSSNSNSNSNSNASPPQAMLVAKAVQLSADVLSSLPQELQEQYRMRVEYVFRESDSQGVPSLTFYPSSFLKEEEISRRKLKASPVVKTSKFTTLVSSVAGDAAKVEAVRDWDAQMIDLGRRHSFLLCALRAWSSHYPLRMKPQHIWLVILQAVATHVEQNAERLREKYVTHEGKKELHLVRDEFVRGSKQNDWAGVVSEFTQEINKFTVEDTVALLESDFSTATMVDRISAKVTIMDICKSYFSYSMSTTCCGFPSVTLEGTREDWALLRSKGEQLLTDKVTKKFGEQWSPALLPLLDRFVAAYDGDIDPVFWNSMVKEGSTHGSGAHDYYSGWINILFAKSFHPYTAQMHYGYGPDVNSYPSGLSSAPVLWTYLGNEINLKFMSGFLGAVQDQNTLELCPLVDWFIVEKGGETAQEKQQKYYEQMRRRWQ